MRWEKVKYPFCFSGRLPDNRVKLFEEFVQFFGFDRMAIAVSVKSYEKLLHGNRSYNHAIRYDDNCFDDVPQHDHARIFKIKGTDRLVYVNQPYSFDKEKLEKWCNKRDLIYVICNKKYSFYYPYNTEMVLIMSPDTYVAFGDIPEFPRRWEE